MKPCLKACIEIRQNGDDLYFQNTNTGDVQSFEVDETFVRMLGMLDGGLTEAEILERLQAGNPALTFDDVAQTLREMHNRRLIEDVHSLPDAPPFSPHERERLDRQIQFLGEFAPADMDGIDLQKRLCGARVAIFGLGGTGSWTALLLAQAGVGRMRLIDYDTVELSNLNRQVLFQVQDVGDRKTQVAQRKLLALAPELQVETYDLQVTESTDLYPLLDEVDVVVNCTDNPSTFATSLWIAKACMRRGIPHVIGGGYNGHLGMLGPTILPGRSPCWGCYARVSKSDAFYDYPIIRPRQSRPASINVIASLVASIQAAEVLKVLTKMAHPAMLGRKGTVDIFTLNITYDVFRRHPRCELCGSASSTDSASL